MVSQFCHQSNKIRLYVYILNKSVAIHDCRHLIFETSSYNSVEKQKEILYFMLQIFENSDRIKEAQYGIF